MAQNHQEVESDSDSDMVSNPAFTAFGGDTMGSGTTATYSVRSGSPIPSVLSLSSSMRAQAFILEYGRGLNNNSDVYRLPADEEEMERLREYSLIVLNG
jgi:hypothetical protein